MTMLTELLYNANVLQELKKKIGDVLFRSSGWSIPDDTDTGISFGEAVDVGGGYMEMDVRDGRIAGKPASYEMRGGYVEVGVGIGEISKAQAIVNRIVKVMPRGARPSSDLVVMPGGSITPFIMGATQRKHSLELDDFKYSSWIYVHIGAEFAVLSGDIGLMFMVDQSIGISAVANFAVGNIGGVLSSLMGNCLAWAPYYGTALGLGAGGKIAVRVIQTVQMNQASPQAA
jgi:hypothetical protein